MKNFFKLYIKCFVVTVLVLAAGVGMFCLMDHFKMPGTISVTFMGLALIGVTGIGILLPLTLSKKWSEKIVIIFLLPTNYIWILILLLLKKILWIIGEIIDGIPANFG